MTSFPNLRIAPLLKTALLAASIALVTACGGGGDSPAVQTAGTTERATAYAAGPITGFGSIIVNGIRFDDSAATVTDDDDRARSREMLKLGMLVAVDGAALDAAGTVARALRIRYGSQIVGPVSARTDSTLTVLGQVVAITDMTVFDTRISGGLAGVTIGDVVEVHALLDASTGQFSARRIDSEPEATTYKLQGEITRLDTAAKNFEIGGQVIRYGSIDAADLPVALADGLRVVVRLQTAQVSGQWVATAVRGGQRKLADRPDARLRGAITAFASATEFEVNGLKVDAANALFPDGSAALAVGTVVEIKGSIVDGTLVATRVELDSRHAAERHRFELHGLVTGLDTSAKTFMLRNIRVNYGGSVAWRSGSEADLANGSRVEVKGTPSADRTQLDALSIGFER